VGKDGTEPVPVSVKGKTYHIKPGHSQNFKL